MRKLQRKKELVVLKFSLIFVAAISVANGANTAPTCPNAVEVQTIPEDTGVGATVIILNCTDGDAGSDGNLTYTINSGNDDFVFQISTDFNTKQGLITLVLDWDYDAFTQSYTLVIGVNDQGTPALGDTVTVNLFVTGINDNEPFTIGSPVYVDIFENHELFTEVVVASAFDLDFINSVDYQSTSTEISSTSDPNCDKFLVEPETGKIILTGSLDYEKTTSCNVTLKVTDVGLTPAKSSTGFVLITIDDVNDNKPTCENTVYGTEILESAAVNDVIVDLNCSDVESTNQVSCFIVDGNAADKFDVVNCVVKLKNTVDVDLEDHSYTLTITVRDQDVGGVTLKLTRTVFVTVEVGAIDDNQPTWAAPDNGIYTVSVDENSAVGTLLVTISATDADKVTAEHGQVTYSIDSTTDMFEIDTDTGKILVKNSSLDRELVDSYVLTISAYSSNQTDQRITGNVTVSVRDLNDNTPQFGQTLHTVIVTEDAAINTTLATANATDKDNNANGQVSYSITSGNTATGCTGLSIDATSGVITNIASLDYESSTSCELVVQAADGGSPSLSSTAKVIISITPVNEFVPTFSSNVTVSVPENATVGTSVTTVGATDGDSGVDGQIVYSLTNYNETFNIDTSSGEIKTTTGLDRETTDTYELVILATDQSLTNVLTGTVTVMVNINDVNDNIPSFSQTLYTVTIAEDSALNTVLVTCNATDPDKDANGQVTHSIISGNTASGCTGLSIDATTGVITNTASLDYDSSTSCELVVQAADGGSPSLSSTAKVIIFITPVNEFVPTFSSNVTVSVQENISVGTLVTNVNATDGDSGVDGQIVYSLTNYNETFNIDTSSGEIKTTTELDRETTDMYELVILATDQSLTNVLTGTVTVIVNINDVNDHIPSFSQTLYTVTTAEESALNTVLVTCNTTDPDKDANGQVTHSIISGNTATGCTGLSIDATSGVITNTASLDYDSSTSCELVVQAADGGSPSLSSTAKVIIIITPVNEFVPTFSSNVTVSIQENLSVGTLVTNVNATDGDSGVDGQIVYSLTNYNETFNIDTSSGEIKTTTELDRETTDMYELVILATDQSLTNVLTGTVTVMVNINDVNDNIPSFSQTLYTVTTAEDSALNTVLVTCNATDPDKDANGQVTHSILSGNTATGCTGLSIDATTGVITNTVSLDYDSSTSCELVVQAADGGSPSLSSTAKVIIIITPVNEFVPTFSSNVTVSILENVGIDTSVTKVVATDGDSGADGQIVYSLTNYNDTFVIDTSTGEVKTAALLDRESTEIYELIILATDQSLTKVFTGTVTVIVNIDDVNDNTPAFSSIQYFVTTAENTTLNTVLMAVNATDPDNGTNGQVSYSIASGNTGAGCTGLTVDGTNGDITNTQSLDYDSATKCSLSVVATDGEGRASTAAVLITVTNVNEFTPIFTSNLTVNIPEDTNPGLSVGNVAASDSDSGVDGDITYYLDNHTTVFTINSANGDIYLVSDLDRETTSEYQVVIRAVDGAVPNDAKKTGYATVTVTIDDVNDNKPFCVDIVVKEKITAASLSVGDVVHAFNCSDADDGTNGNIVYNLVGCNQFSVATDGKFKIASLPFSQLNYICQVNILDQGTPTLSNTAYINVEVHGEPTLTNIPVNISIQESEEIGTEIYNVTADVISGSKQFEIVSGNAENKFKINAFSGKVYLYSTLDRETTPSYDIGIKVTDLISSLAAIASINITLTDANDNVPQTPLSFYVLSIAENSAIGTTIQNMAATDPDEGVNADLLYSIASGNADGTFSMNTIGDLLINNTLDAETTKEYKLTVIVRDNGSPQLTGTTTVFINVTNIDEHPVEFLSVGYTYNVTLAEDTALSSMIFKVRAQDLDVNTKGIIYSITGGNTNSAFSVVSSTGEIYLDKYLDRETTASYSLTATASNGAGDNASTTVDITVTDVNDNDPSFSSNVYTATVDETEALGALVKQVIYSDADEGINKNVTLSIVAGNTGNAFRLDGDKLEVNTALDFATVPGYLIIIKAEDQGTPSRSSSATVDVDINPIYKTPKFAVDTQSLNIPENKAKGDVILDGDADQLGATEGVDLKYTILAGNGDGKFSIDPTTGVIKLVGDLDREIISTYNLVIKAENSKNNLLDDTLALTITVGDVNDNDPVFNPASYIFFVDEKVANGYSVGSVTATDADSGTNSDLLFSLIAGENMNDFTIDSSTGEVKVNATLDSSVQSSYYLTVQAADGGTPSRSSNTVLVITVNDLNDNVPAFDFATYNLQISESVNIGQTVAVFKATDLDPGANGQVSYRIISGNGHFKFSINSFNGSLEMFNTIDRETLDNYVLVIEAVDGGTPSPTNTKTGTATVSIKVTDYNDNSPIPSSSVYSLTVPRATSVSSYLTRLSATDADTGSNSVINYYLLSGNTDNLFLIDSSSGNITTVSSLMTGKDNYTLLIKVTDNGVPALSATATVSIALDPPLTPTVSNYEYTVAENKPLNTDFGVVTINPVHASGATVNFTITSGNGDSIFAIGLTSGALTLVKSLDYETRKDHYLTILIQDRAVLSLIYNKQVHVEVTDVNDNTPTFTSVSYTAQIIENSPVGFPVNTVSATDPDSSVNGQLTYFLSPTFNPSALQYLQIDGSTGKVTLKQSPDFETITAVVTEVLVKDAGTPSLTGTAQFIVNFVNILDDNTGSGTACFISTEVPTNFINNEVIVTLTPSDFGLSKGISDTVNFQTVGQGGVFGMTPSTGEFYVLDSNLLYDNAKYVLTVLCEVKTPNNNVTAASCLVRIDTVKPNEIVVLRHSVSQAVIEPQLNALIAALQNEFPSTRRVGICKVTDLTSTSNRRKLLATESESQMFVVSDTSADSLEGLSRYKTFSSQSEILSVIQQSSDGMPISALSSASFTSFPITSVTAYSDSSSSSKTWPETTVGIAVLSTIGCSIVLLAAILTTYFCCTRERKYRLNKEEKNSKVSPNRRVFDSPDPPMYQIEDKSPLVAPYKSSPVFTDNRFNTRAAYSVETTSKMNGNSDNPKSKPTSKTSKTTKMADSEESNTSLRGFSRQLGPGFVDHVTNSSAKLVHNAANTISEPNHLHTLLNMSSKQRRANKNNRVGQNPKERDSLDILLKKAGFGLQSIKRLNFFKSPHPVLSRSCEMVDETEKCIPGKLFGNGQKKSVSHPREGSASASSRSATPLNINIDSPVPGTPQW